MDKSQLSKLPSPFYRVATRAVIFDGQHRLLVVESARWHDFELPGGGWEYDESFEECLARELHEELGAEAEHIGKLWFTYRGQSRRWGYWMLRIAVPVTLKSLDIQLSQDHISARFVTREEFLALNWCDEDRQIIEHVDLLWPPTPNRA